MRFADFDAQMRVYENSLDQVIVPGMYIVARLDGRGFTKLTKAKGFDKPFDDSFKDMMVATVKGLMLSNSNIVYGYTESDEISLLFRYNDNTFGRKVRKLNSLLAGQASAIFSSLLGSVAVFDCRIIPLPNKELVEDYFLWRQEDSYRNSLNGYCYWTLRQGGKTKGIATSELWGKGSAFKKELLLKYDIDFDKVTPWHKTGIGLYFNEITKKGYNPKEDKEVVVTRHALYEDATIPYGDDYRLFIRALVEKA